MEQEMVKILIPVIAFISAVVTWYLNEQFSNSSSLYIVRFYQ
jgi:hypothetical protein